MTSDRPAADPDRTEVVLREGARVFGRYTLQGCVGEGGMGVVWRARDEKLERDVALKFLPERVRRDPDAVRELKRETTRCLSLTHEHIVRVYDFVEDRWAAAIAMEYVAGRSLAALKVERAGGCFDAGDLAPLLLQLCSALEYAHGHARVVHRDLKPANVLVTAAGVLKVADFGIARSLADSHTRQSGEQTGAAGTLAFMGPQQLAGEKVAPADDVYSLGATLYDLLTGKPPFHTGDLFQQIRETRPAPLAERRAELGHTGAPIPAEWERTILECLAKRAEDRPSSAGAVLVRIGALAGDPEKTVQIGVPSVESSRLAGGGPAPAGASPAAQEANAPAPAAPPAPARAEKIRLAEARLRRLRFRTYFALAGVVLVLMGLGAWYFGSRLPKRWRAEAEQLRSEQVKAEARRVAGQRVEAAAREQAETEQRNYAVVEARIDALVDGAPAALRDSTEAAVKNYLATAPERKRAEVADRLAVRLTAWEAARQAALRGGAIITTDPTGAEVRLGSRAAERAPLTLKALKPGVYPVRVRLAGHDDWEGALEVKADSFGELHVPLVRSTGGLELASVPAGAEAEIRRQRSEVGGQRSEGGLSAVGLAEAEGRTADDRRRTAEGGRRTAEDGRRTAEGGGGTAEVRKVTTPAKVEQLPPGEYEVAFRREGYRPAVQRVEVKAKVIAPVAATLEKISGPEFGQRWTVPGVNLELVPIAAGTLAMGSAPGEPGRYENEGPVTRVTLSKPYWLGKTEVTQGEWRAVMGDNPAGFQGDERPVEQVSWDEAVAFGRRLTAREREAGRLPEGYGYRLPTEAQWEQACRAGTTGESAESLADLGWYQANSGGETHPVGRKRANAWGLHDMRGNVWEWCADRYADKLPGGSVRDYAGPAEGANRVLRGGSWDDDARHCRVPLRAWLNPAYRGNGLGFRVALAPEPPAEDGQP